MSEIHSAVGADDFDRLKELLASNPALVNATDKSDKEWGQWTPLSLAAARGHKEMVELLLAKGAEVNAIDLWGKTPWDHAVLRPSTDMAELLLHHGADVSCRDHERRTSLHWAVRYGRLEMTKFLLTKGADVNARSRTGMTPLHCAIWSWSSAALAELLLSHGADINAGDWRGFTPLHCAFVRTSPNLAALMLLVGKGADVEARDKDGLTAFERGFELKGAAVEIYVALFRGDRDRIVSLLKSDPCLVGVNDKLGFGLLGWAILLDNREAAVLLVQHGPKAGPQSEYLTKGLEWAVFWGRKNMVELLLTSGANLHAKDRQGATLLQIATKSGYPEIAELLRQHGAIE